VAACTWCNIKTNLSRNWTSRRVRCGVAEQGMGAVRCRSGTVEFAVCGGLVVMKEHVWMGTGP
jgi:hypothetical protein